MQSMFLEAKRFNQDISGWKVNNVQDMCMMFCDASSFDQNLNGWKPGKVRDKRLMQRKTASPQIKDGGTMSKGQATGEFRDRRRYIDN